MRTVLGKVVGLAGAAEIVDQQGQHHLLKAGDALHEGDQLITVAGAQVTMQVGNGELVQFAEQQAIKLSEVLSASPELVDISEHAVNPAVIQHLLAALQLNDAIDLSLPLTSTLQDDSSAFVSITHASVTERVLQPDALNIHDVLISGDNHAALPAAVMPVTQLADLMTQTSTIDIGLPNGPIKDFLND
ncbi:hypothetical protein [Methylophilus luteus]|uniref:Retention module-containing protein n=1 Tax=Methylophilus luteus TaxID=640108 RepID=A0ABW3F615_9PROT